jgi:hypothetical protein
MWKALRIEEALPFSGTGFAASARSRRQAVMMFSLQYTNRQV